MLPKKLPSSSYEVIRLPPINKTITKKGFCHQKQGPKRPKHMPPLVRQAEDIRSKLEPRYCSFTKVLVKSHVTGPFWMGLPQPFCKKYMPEKDTYFILENQNGGLYTIKYLADKTAFSGGWRGFAMIEKLFEGDVLIFQLVNPTKFKVYRIRESDLTEGNRACADVRAVEQNMGTCQASYTTLFTRDEDHQVLLNEDSREMTWQEGNAEKINSEISSEKSKQSPCPPAVVGYNGFSTSFEEFLVLINELLKRDLELPQHIKWSYYQLCSGQNVLLHDRLLKGISPVLVAGSIIETVNIADAIKNCDLTTFYDKLTVWDQKLKSLEVLGMEVSFLHAHLQHLRKIANDPEAVKNRQQFSDLCSEHSRSGQKIKNLQAELSELTRVSQKRADDIKKLETEIEEQELRFQEQVSAPW